MLVFKKQQRKLCFRRVSDTHQRFQQRCAHDVPGEARPKRPGSDAGEDVGEERTAATTEAYHR